ncbi:unnamed protein product [Triticum aestivum]|uniref:DUF4283 domain-containing protein n=2 Tax=Triticum aestivum TaxID=4565 RepID=A0A9R1JDQ3_WHEAT|nr:hypothetical protein CFC21_027798 [Triticum aestivum]SPT16084.1 unnamed protein product [Triticum aestivum]
MEAPAADPEVRRGLVIATTRRTAGMAEAERRLTRCAVVAVVFGAPRQVELVDVKRAMAMRFRIQEDAVKVSPRALGEMLLIFDDTAVRDRVLSGQGPLVLGQLSLLVAPWSRFRRASPAKLLYKVRVCLEGVPEHAWDIDSVASLFDPSMLIDEVDHEVRREEETGCFRLWVWMDAVEKLKTRGVLQLEEPREVGSPEMHFPEINITQEVPARWGQVSMLGHPVLIHLDHVVDFTCPPESSPSSGMSCDSGVSGLPSEDGAIDPWPARWGYRWYLNYEDVDFPPPPPRAPVHSRLRFPDAGGSGGGGGRRTYGSGSGYREAIVGMQQLGGGGRQRQEREGSGGGNGGGGRRRAELPEAPPLIDTAVLEDAPTGSDPFPCTVEDLQVSHMQLHGRETMDLDGMDVGGRKMCQRDRRLVLVKESWLWARVSRRSWPRLCRRKAGRMRKGGRRPMWRWGACMAFLMQASPLVHVRCSRRAPARMEWRETTL